MSEKALAAGTRVVTLKSGREVTLVPHAFWGLSGLINSLWRANNNVLAEMGQHGIDGHTAAATIFAIMGDPDKWVALAAPETVLWLVGPCIKDIERNRKGDPDLDGYTSDEVMELLPIVADMTDFEAMGDRLKNSLLPVVKSVQNALASGKESPGTNESPEKS